MDQLKPNLLIDADGILLDFTTASLDLISALRGKKVHLDDFKTWDFFSELDPEELKVVEKCIRAPGWCASLKPLPGSQDAIFDLRKMVNIFCVTSPYYDSPTWCHERYQSLSANFAIPNKDVVITMAKFLVEGEYFLDDNPEHVANWVSSHPTSIAMLWDYPNTRGAGWNNLRISSWDEVLQKVFESL